MKFGFHVERRGLARKNARKRGLKKYLEQLELLREYKGIGLFWGCYC